MHRRVPPMGVRPFTVTMYLTCLVVLWSIPGLGATRKGDPLIGRKLYMTHCFTCHGVTGKGDGPAAVRLEPRPRNLTDDAYMSGKTDQDLYNVISGGSAVLHRFSGMPEWKQLFYPERIRDIIAYLRTLHRPPAGKEHPLVRKGNIDSGKRLFADYCAVCHGSGGRGDGPLAAMFGPRPFDFTDQTGMAARRDQDLYFAIFGGGEAIGKSAFMPRWAGLLREQEIWDVIAYLRAFPRQ